jgi:hypothetical protein
VRDSWETFTLRDLGNNQVALQAANGMYVCAEGGGGPVVANRPVAGPWDAFTLYRHGNLVSLQSMNGLFLCAEGGVGSSLVANRATAGPWETFEMLDLGSGKIALRTLPAQMSDASMLVELHIPLDVCNNHSCNGERDRIPGSTAPGGKDAGCKDGGKGGPCKDGGKGASCKEGGAKR